VFKYTSIIGLVPVLYQLLNIPAGPNIGYFSKICIILVQYYYYLRSILTSLVRSLLPILIPLLIPGAGLYIVPTTTDVQRKIICKRFSQEKKMVYWYVLKLFAKGLAKKKKWFIDTCWNCWKSNSIKSVLQNTWQYKAYTLST
jgi:hypothetical protein